MRQERIRLSLTRHDAAVLYTVLIQAIADEPGMLIPEDAKAAGKIVGRLWGLLHPRSRLGRH
jgi:hypothetical protein